MRRLALLFLAACGPAKPAQVEPHVVPDAAPAAGPDAAHLDAAEHVAQAYLALTVESVRPAPPATLAATAWAVLGLGDAPTFGDDAADDAQRFRDAAGALEPGSEWRAIDAMAFAAGAQIVDPEGVANLRALASGAAYTGPGFVTHRDATGAVVVTDVFVGGPGEGATLAVADVITAIAGEPPPPDVVGALLLEPAGTRFELAVDRAGAPQTLTLSLATQAYPVVATRLQSHALIIRVLAMTDSTDATRDTGALVRAAMTGLDAKKIRGVVLDLRGAHGDGGVAALASIFVTAKELVSFRDSAGETTSLARSGDVVPWPHPVDVLVDDETSGGAELAAFALHDQGSIRVIGTPTAGGLARTTALPLDARHVLVYPTALAVGPVSGRSTAQVVPDQKLAAPSAADVVAGKDAPLAAAITWATRKKP